MDPTQIGTLAVTGVISAGATVGLMRFIFGNQVNRIEKLEKCKVDSKLYTAQYDGLTKEVRKIDRTLHGDDGISGIVKSIHYIEGAIKRYEKNGGSFSGE